MVIVRSRALRLATTMTNRREPLMYLGGEMERDAVEREHCEACEQQQSPRLGRGPGTAA